MAQQFEFPFDSSVPAQSGLDEWRARRAEQLAEVCRKLGLPLNVEVEIELNQGPILRGKLQLAEELLLLDANRNELLLRVGTATFVLTDVASAVRL